ncbi:GyrI-like domain-containing protein [Bacillus sp. SL00103]
MNYKIEIVSNMKMVYMRNKGPYGSKENVEMMKRFNQWINQHQLNDELKEDGIYGVPQDDPEKFHQKNADTTLC